MSEHTKEPWVLNYDEALEDGDLGRVIFSAHWQNDNGDLNAQRIVACVNFCAGESTEMLERGNEYSLKRIVSESIITISQRDKLLDALKLAQNFTEELTRFGGKYPYINGTGLISDAYKIDTALNAIIAEVEADK